MKYYAFTEKPFKIFGVPHFDQTREFRRLPEWLEEKLPLQYKEWKLGRRCPGARVGFRTNSAKIALKVKFKTLSTDPGMAPYAYLGAHAYAGPRTNPTYAARALELLEGKSVTAIGCYGNTLVDKYI